jgi:hypothetical protein
MHASTNASRSTSNATRNAGPLSPGAGAARGHDPKQGLRGLGFAEQEQKLKPPSEKPGGASEARRDGASGKGRGTPVAPTFDVSHTYSDGEYEGVARYGAQFVGNECRLTVRCLMNAEKGIGPDEINDIETMAREEVANVWDNKFTITDKQTHQAYKLRVALVFTADNPHITVDLGFTNSEVGGREDEGHWFLDTSQSDSTTFAHEIGHALGLGDEYVDVKSAHRKNDNDSGVFHDDSIMADGKSETAHAMLRHGTQIAGDIGAASHRQFDAALTPPAAPAPAHHGRGRK